MSHAGLIATTLERPDERGERARLAAAAPGSPSASSQSLIISSNLRAALEYEERIRSPAPGSGFGSVEWGGGLPPPPRPKSRPRTARVSPAGSLSVPASPVSPPQTTDVAGSGAGMNPYINPVPRLSYLMRDEAPLIIGDQADARSIEQGSSDSLGTNSSRATDEPACVTPATTSSSPPSAGKEGLRHLRGLSSLQKVEKMIGKSKKSLGMVAEGNLKLASRRVSDADMQGAGSTAGVATGAEKAVASVLYASSTPNSPISAVSVSLTGRRMQTTDGAKEDERVRVRVRGDGDGRGASVPQPAAVAGGPGHSHARRELEFPISDGDATGSSNIPSIATHRPISISSTIYSSSVHSFAPPPRSPASRPTAMNDHRESFIELASPTFSPTEAQSYPFSAFSSPHETQPHTHIPYSSHDDFGSHPRMSHKPLLAPLSTAKPPVPTAAKPDFSSRRSKSAQRSVIEHDSPSAAPSPLESSPDDDRRLRDRPSTSNFLHPQERADLVRKTRKLTQLFGQTPGVGHYPVEVDFGHGHAPRANLVGSPPNPSRRKHKPAASMLDDPIVPVYDTRQRVVWPPREDAQSVTISARRRSVPFSPQEFSTRGGVSGSDGRSSLAISASSRGDTSHVIEIGSQEGVPNSDWDSHTGLPDREASASPQSFIDLSDEEGLPAAFPDSRSPATPKARALHRRPDSLLSPSTPSLLLDGLSLSEEQQAEEDRRRKREKLAKLHRFLGSRVPAHLVLGSLQEGVPLPPPAPQTPQDEDMPDEDADARKIRLRRRRSSSAAELATWSDEIDRVREDLNGREKAINVRRAVKMEKMFGVAPPQVLYHTRQAASSPGGSGVASVPAPAKMRHSPQSSAPQPPGAGPSSGRNLNQTSYKGKSKKGARPGTAESTQPLIDHAHADAGDDAWDGGGGGGGKLAAMSDVYLHYRHSLNSLNDIIDRDDRQSLAELHDYLSGRGQDAAEPTPTEDSVFALAQAGAAKAERRRSMPSRMSMASVSSEWTLLPSPPPEESLFQQRRRRAAKLTQFFGVNYRDLMNEILESIEKGLEEERGRGTLKPDEVQDLLQKLRKLKTKRNNWP